MRLINQLFANCSCLHKIGYKGGVETHWHTAQIQGCSEPRIRAWRRMDALMKTSL
jgi:hypothetical protein